MRERERELGASRERDLIRLDDWRTERNDDDWGELNETGRRRRLVSGGDRFHYRKCSVHEGFIVNKME